MYVENDPRLVYCDTNFWITVHAGEAMHDHSRSIMNAIESGELHVVVSDLLISEFSDAIKRYVSRHAKKHDSPEDLNATAARLEAEFKNKITVLLKSGKAIKDPHSESVARYQSMVLNEQRRHPGRIVRRGTMFKSDGPQARDIEHALIALQAGASILYTEDKGLAKLRASRIVKGLRISVLGMDKWVLWPWNLKEAPKEKS